MATANLGKTDAVLEMPRHSSQLGQRVFPGRGKGTNAVFSMKDVRSGDDGEIVRSDGTSAASGVISEISAASEHSTAV